MAHPSFTPGSPQDLVIEVELTISAKQLQNKDVTSKSDPMCVLYVQNQSKAWIEQGRTEVLQNSLNPQFATKIKIGYRFEEQQKLLFKIYDIDSRNPVLDTHDFLGQAECSLGQIVSAGDFTTPLNDPKGNKGKAGQQQLCVRAEEIGSSKEEVDFLFFAQDFKKSGMFSKPDPFLAIYKDGNNLVHRTNFIKDDLNPRWPKFTVPMRSLRSKDGQETKLSLQVWNYNSDGSHKLMGEVQVTTGDLLAAPKSFALSEKDKKQSGKSAPKLTVQEAVVKRTYTFLDFITSGTQLNCTVAIDFTASNGDPRQPNSLHFMGPTPTLYEQVLQAVVTIIQDYDSDKQFPVLGFGAKIPPMGTLSHEFFVNLQPNPYCAGVGGVIEAYRRCLPVVTLFGPTNFAPVINHVARFAASHPNGDHYFILLILTDGAISDMHETKQAIIAASHLGMSIVIVGIGNADFSSMNELDSDHGMLSVGGRTASRDIVQFVPFRDFLHQPDPYRASADLTRALLAEIPNQLVSYMKARNIAPRNVHA